MPIGTVIAWPLITDPDGVDQDKWLECNGQIINSSKYPKLAALMVRAPNYQGVFLRGFGSQYSNHYNTVLHKSASMGELQGDAIRNITAKGAFWDQRGYGQAREAFYISPERGHFGSGDSDNDNNELNFDASLVVPTTNENRPVNVAVRYLIRAA